MSNGNRNVSGRLFMTPQPSDIYFRQDQIDRVFAVLTSTDKELQKRFNEYLLVDYEDESLERLYYLDMSEISRFIVDKIKAGQTSFFKEFFNQIEFILSNCDDYVGELIVIGLFEGIQNVGGKDINYYQSFDQWLKPLSKQNWDELIDFWEGQDWRAK
ncbi:MAG: hypothetical protein EOO61_21715 [Hymenobacter sp.]|nr:MAG: hypothetical protein EOO61_21715 [Hymenobacter sp.]